MTNEISDAPVKKTRKSKKAELPEATPSSSLRNENGLLKVAQYEYDQYGFINWRKLVSPEHIVLNRLEMAKIGVDVKLLSKDEREKYLTDLGDDKKLIKLAGFRELAKIRGTSKVAQTLQVDNGVVYCSCTIDFIPNIETDFKYYSYTAVASASCNDVTPSFSHALAAIASNRAFGRCIREALNISVVTEEEINPNENPKIVESPQPLLAVKEKCLAKGIEFATLLKYLEGKGHVIDPNWVSFESLPTYVALDCMSCVKENG